MTCVPERVQSRSTELLIVMVVTVIMVLFIPPSPTQLAHMSLSITSGVVVILWQMLLTRRLTGRLHNNRRHRRGRRPQYRASVTVHRTALVFLATFCLWLLDHYRFHCDPVCSRCKGFAHVTLDLLAQCLHCQSWNRTCRRRLAANLRAFELASNHTPAPERARVA